MIGAAAVMVPLTDPVMQLSEQVRVEGPIILSTDAPVDGAGAVRGSTPLPQGFAPQTGVSLVPTATAAGRAQSARGVMTALSVTAAPLLHEPDAHVWAYLAATAPRREQALALGRNARIEVQRRLSLLGYDTAGIDGVLGPRSREAIATWQHDYGFPETGYLDEAVLASLEERSADVWAEWKAEHARQIRHAAKRTPSAPELANSPAERAACVRGEDGKILGSQGFGCDLKGVKEGFQRFFAKLGTGAGDPNGLPPAGVDR